MMRVISGLLVAVGLVIAILPIFFTVPDDEPFFRILRQEEKLGSDWSNLRGVVSVEGTSYAYTAEKTRNMNDRGEITSHEEVLTMQDATGQTRVYRRTRYFNAYGSPAEHVEKSPTRTIKRGRGPTGNDSYSEVVLSESASMFSRQSVRWSAHGIGAILAMCGLVLLFLPTRKTK